MSDVFIQKLLKLLVQEQINESFIDHEKATDEAALGIMVSHYCEWSSPPIFEVIEAILEDSNFHELNAAFRSLVENPANIKLLKKEVKRQ